MRLFTASALSLSLLLIAPVHAIYFFPLNRAEAHGGGQTILSDSKRPPWRPPTDLPTRHTPFQPPQAQKLVKPLLGNVSTERMYDDLKGLTDFHTRHHLSQDGRQSQLWLLYQVKQVIETYENNGPEVTVTEFEHADFPQRTIVARIQGSNISQDDSLVIIGAHQDSKNYKFPEERSPGADDDGSGTVTLLEALRVLGQASYAPARTVELHWYAAEEGGLYGSRDLAAKYKEDGKKVAAMTQYDATAWVKNGTDEVIGIVSSDVDLGLVSFHVQLVNEYLDLPSTVYRLSPNAGSDHMAWHWQGFSASFLTESLFENMNPHFHTPDDRMDISPEFSFEHMRRFTQHAIAFIVEVAGGNHTWADGAH